MNAGSAIEVAPLRCEARGDAIACRQALAELEPLDQRLQDGGDDHRAARRADGQDRPPVPGDDGRRHRAARPLAALGRVRVVEVGVVEVRQLVVEQEAVARHDDAVAARRLDRERVRDDVAVVVGDGQVRRRRALLGETDGAGRPAVTARNGGVDRLLGDQRAPLGREAVGEQAAQRHVDVVGVGRGTRCGRRTRSATPRGSSAATACGRAPTAAGPRGCSAPRRRSSRRSTAGPCPRRRGPCSRRGSARARRRRSGARSRSVIRPGRQTWLASAAIGGSCAAAAIARATGPL